MYWQLGHILNCEKRCYTIIPFSKLNRRFMSAMVDVMKSIFHSKSKKNQLIIGYQLKTRDEGNKKQKFEKNQEYNNHYKAIQKCYETFLPLIIVYLYQK